MKYYRMEPQYKKCVVEFQRWTRTVDGVEFRLEREQGWRWGAFLIKVPETKEEIADFCAQHDYDESEFEDIQLLPDDDEDFIEADDYHAQLFESVDGCWQEWCVTSHQDHDEDQAQALAEEAEAAWEEEWDTGVEQLGWAEDDPAFYCEIHCKVDVVECDELGTALE